MKRIFRAIAAMSLAVVGATVVAASPAAAGALDVTCLPPSSNVNSYSPPLTNQPQPVTASTTALYGPCTSVSHPAITSGSRTATVPLTASCLDLLGSGTLTYTITWNTGQTSTITSNFTRTVVGAVYEILATGTVTAGVFAGDSVVTDFTGPSTDITLCTLGLGTVSSVYNVGTLEITSL
ncbi:MAG: hypothetical protein HOU81_25155 [Hamadaea sp.]|uniref:hypothetical protein n=1 Tax=Hamadaea sp. TaxID=2024425 RepID=UPI001854F3E3|nr:hypothetical protein [Hamadaea sp.]NUR74110.1 hypothetical protein [Hamadaea sp.]NUT19983.1 hypothetical protein [Hamadaea sp.]